MVVSLRCPIPRKMIPTQQCYMGSTLPCQTLVHHLRDLGNTYLGGYRSDTHIFLPTAFHLTQKVSRPPAALQYPMANPLAITVEQAREIVHKEARSKGWVRPELRQSQNPETIEILETLRKTRESLGDIVDTYTRPLCSVA